MINATDTIAALATPPIAARRAIVRMSGPDAWTIAMQVSVQMSMPVDVPDAASTPSDSARPSASRIGLQLADGIIVPAVRLAFFAPRSSTGEDVVEFHLPGSPFLVGLLLKRLFAVGARQAEPGEFTARAFFHGKLDLAAAEGVVATIAASNRAELDAARQLLAGELARRLSPVMETLARTLALVEVGIDFADEDVSFISRPDVLSALSALDRELASLLAGSTRFERIAHEPRIVLAGRPNAGKSTLLNVLAGVERSVVSEAAGTTRDALSAPILLPSGRAFLVDVAGLANEGQAGDPQIAEKMKQAALREIESADVVVQVIDAMDSSAPLTLPREPNLAVWTKADRLSTRASDPTRLVVSAWTGTGLDAFKRRLDEIAFPCHQNEQSTTLALNARHVTEIGQARAAIQQASVAIDQGPEFVASELRTALDHLGRILGTVSPDDVLGRIFSSFCIGK